MSTQKLTVLEKLAEGGMGEVYRVLETTPGGEPRQMVAKRMRPDLAVHPELVAMFRNEASLATRLEHPNLTRVFGLGGQTGELLLMEWIDGLDLSKLMNARGRALAWRPAVQIGHAVASALGYMHRYCDDGKALRLVHRDVSLSNIMVAADGAVKLLDFGIAKALGSGEQTGRGSLKGKLPYLAPEQLLGCDIDERVDQYSLGVVLYELMWGRRLFRENVPLVRLTEQRTRKVLRLGARRPTVPPWVDLLVMRLLEPEPGRRFASCQEVVQVIESWIEPSLSPADLMPMVGECMRLVEGRDTIQEVR